MRRGRILLWASLAATLAACAAALAAAIGETGADFAVVPSGAYPALEGGLTGLGFSRVLDDGCLAVYASKPVL